MKFTIDIPDREWAAMVKRAEEHNMRLPDLIRHTLRELMPHRPPLADMVATLARAGMPDALIAERLGTTNSTVATMRRRAGIPANRFNRGGSRTKGNS